MKRTSIVGIRAATRLSVGVAALIALVWGASALPRAAGPTVTPTLVGADPTFAPSPIGIDWLPNKLLVSSNYPGVGTFNFSAVDRQTSAYQPWATVSGWNNEIYFSTVRPIAGAQSANWTVGDVFSAQGGICPQCAPGFQQNGTGQPDYIAQFQADGTLVSDQFAHLVQTKDGAGNTLATPIAETKQKRGGVEFDRFGVAGYDLIVIASNDVPTGSPSDVYRINAAGQVTHLAHVENRHLEGITTIPNDAAYGPFAGKILTQAEYNQEFWTIDPGTGATATYAAADVGGLPIAGEDLWVVPGGSAFYGVEWGDDAISNNRLWRIDASQWTPYVGQIVVAQEYNAQLYTIAWDSSLPCGAVCQQSGLLQGDFVANQIYAGSADGTTGPHHWEHITFIPTAAIGDFVWADSNGNGLQDSGEPGIGGVTVTAYTCSNVAVGVTTTNSSGYYGFTNLDPGCYYVVFSRPSGLVPTTQSTNMATTNTSKADATGQTPPVSVGAGETYLALDAGFVQPPPPTHKVTLTKILLPSTDTGKFDLTINNTTAAAQGNGGYVSVNVVIVGSTVNVSEAAALGSNLANYTSVLDCPGTNLPSGRTTSGSFTMPDRDVACTVTNTRKSEGALTTYTQGGWGAPPNGNNPGALLKAKFSIVYPGGFVQIGGTNKLTFTSQAAIEAFLPAGGKASTLTANATNPTSSSAGVFAGQVLALRLSVDFSNAGITKVGLATMKVKSGALAGKTVAQVLALANDVIGGNTSALTPYGLTLSGLNDIVTKINENFDNGTANGGFLVP